MGMGKIGQTCCKCSGIDQTFCGSGQDLSGFLQKLAGLVKLPVGVGGIGQVCLRNGEFGQECLQEGGLVKSVCKSGEPVTSVCRNGGWVKSVCRSRRAGQECLREWEFGQECVWGGGQECLQKWRNWSRVSTGVSRFDQTFNGIRWDWSKFLRARWNWSRISIEVVGISLFFFFAGVGGLGQTFCQSRWN